MRPSNRQYHNFQRIFFNFKIACEKEALHLLFGEPLQKPVSGYINLIGKIQIHLRIFFKYLKAHFWIQRITLRPIQFIAQFECVCKCIDVETLAISDKCFQYSRLFGFR